MIEKATAEGTAYATPGKEMATPALCSVRVVAKEEIPMRPDPTPQSAQATGQEEKPLLAVTCRADPESSDPDNNLALPAGDYQLAWAYPVQTAPNAPLSFTYDPWHYASRRKPLDDIADILPGGDALIFVHGFLDSQPQGVSTGLQVEQGLQRTAGPTAVFGMPPMTQPGALRLAKTLDNRLPAMRPRDDPSAAAQPLYRHLIAFTWPTTHRTTGYLMDKAEIARACAFSLANLISDLRAADPAGGAAGGNRVSALSASPRAALPARRVLVIGHSMGCFLVLKALAQLEALRDEQPPEGESKLLIDQLIFYGADVNCDALQSDPQMSKALASSPGSASISHRRNGYGYQALNRVGRLTNYASFHDTALIWSPFANVFTEESDGAGGRARVGWCGPFTISTTHTNVVAVDCSACIYDHAAYFVRHEILEHTARTLAEPAPVVKEPATQPPPLQTTAKGAQGPAHRLWTWYTPVEIIREAWERFFFHQPDWLRVTGEILGWLLTLAILATIIFGIIGGIIALAHAL
jgi:esterase/lipase superfamily enzyme